MTPRRGSRRTPQGHAGLARRRTEHPKLDGSPLYRHQANSRADRRLPFISRSRRVTTRSCRPSVRSPMATSIARAVRGASGMVTTLPPLRVMVRVRCPRSRPRCSISGAGGLGDPQPVQREQRDQRMLRRGPSPAATSRASRARCGPARRHATRNPPADGGCERLVRSRYPPKARMPEPGRPGEKCSTLSLPTLGDSIAMPVALAVAYRLSIMGASGSPLAATGCRGAIGSAS
jgi:hypothetical protein